MCSAVPKVSGCPMVAQYCSLVLLKPYGWIAFRQIISMCYPGSLSKSKIVSTFTLGVKSTPLWAVELLSAGKSLAKMSTLNERNNTKPYKTIGFGPDIAHPDFFSIASSYMFATCPTDWVVEDGCMEDDSMSMSQKCPKSGRSTMIKH